RTGAAFAYDEVRQRAVLFGGSGAVVTGTFGDTWEWDGLAWTPRSFVVAPGPRRSAAAAYDRMRQRVMLVGGMGNNTPEDEHWEYDGTQWTLFAPMPIVAAPNHALVHDAARAETLLLGGADTLGGHGLVYAIDATACQPRP